MVFEWGYNLHDACLRYVHDPHFALFLNVLRGEVSRSAVAKEQALRLASVGTISWDNKKIVFSLAIEHNILILASVCSF